MPSKPSCLWGAASCQSHVTARQVALLTSAVKPAEAGKTIEQYGRSLQLCLLLPKTVSGICSCKKLHAAYTQSLYFTKAWQIVQFCIRWAIQTTSLPSYETLLNITEAAILMWFSPSLPSWKEGLPLQPETLRHAFFTMRFMHAIDAEHAYWSKSLKESAGTKLAQVLGHYLDHLQKAAFGFLIPAPVRNALP